MVAHLDDYAASSPPPTGTTTRARTSATDPDFVDSWPAHCRVGSDGALFHPAAEPAFEHVEAIFRKGHHSAAYSGFEGSTVEADRQVGLADWLRDRAIEQVDVVGIATDHCVRATALDSADEGFETTVLLDLTAGVAPRDHRGRAGRAGRRGSGHHRHRRRPEGSPEARPEPGLRVYRDVTRAPSP